MMEDREEQEAGHAWAEAHVQGLGWVGFDVSNQISPDERYIRVASGQDYAEAAPVKGISIGSRDAGLDVELSVRRQEQTQGQGQQRQSQTSGPGGNSQTQAQLQQKQSQQDEFGAQNAPDPQD